MCAGICVQVYVCGCVCTCVCMSVCVRECVYMSVCACVHALPGSAVDYTQLHTEGTDGRCSPHTPLMAGTRPQY